MDPVVHFEMPFEDKQRAVDFYNKAFGWTANQLGKEYGDYVVVMTTESDDKGPLKKGIINGGLFPKSPDNQHPSVVVSVADIREAMKKVEEAGGKIVGGSKPGEPDDIPGVGLYIAFMDTEGNRVSLLQPKEM